MNHAAEMAGVRQTFGPVVALDDVSIQVQGGTIHALVGENGAGKTTLMKVLYGALKPDQATVKLDGQEVHFRNQRDAIGAGVGMVSQHYSIIPELTALQNLVLGAEPGWVVSRDSAAARAEALAAKMGFSFEWDAPCDRIGPSQAQKLEILKLLWRGAKILILDEPTAMLSPADSEQLYGKLTELAQQGSTVIVVTHRLPEVMSYCQEVTVLRSGRLIGSRRILDTNPQELTEMIIGHAVTAAVPAPVELGEPVLEVKDLTVRGDRGHAAVSAGSFALRAGEVVGLAGVDGNGQRELVQALYGVVGPESGTIWMDGVDITHKSVSARVSGGMRLIPEDRHEEAVIEDWSIAENVLLGFQRHPGTAGQAAALAEETTSMFPTKFDHVSQRLGDLSGGNQQKVVNARALLLSPRCVIAFQPTRGIDVNVTALVFQKFGELARSGAAVLVVNFDIDELLQFCDRVIVINDGKIFEPGPEVARDRQAIGALMVGSA